MYNCICVFICVYIYIIYICVFIYNRLCILVCRGSSLGISTVHSSAQLYELYRAKYSNCTYVDGNLELVDLDQNYNLSFLQDIREVTGYVLIKSVMSEFLWLRNLRIIRGQLLLSQNQRNYSLYVEQNYNNMGLGLKELQFSSLHGKTRRPSGFKGYKIEIFLFMLCCDI